MIKITVMLLILSGAINSAIAATISVINHSVPLISINGSIEKGDAEKLKALLLDKNNIIDGSYIGRLRITSPGGDVDEAITIGQLIKKLNISVSAIDYCSSACFIIYSSAVARTKMGDAKFLLHRPYFNKAYYSKLSLDQAQTKYNRLKEKYVNYLLSVNVPKSLVDEVMQYNSDSALEKSFDEIISTIGWYSPSTEEWLLAKCGNLQANERDDLKKYLSMSHSCDEAYTSSIGISMNYCNYLLNKGQEISSCRSSSLHAERKKIYQRIM